MSSTWRLHSCAVLYFQTWRHVCDDQIRFLFQDTLMNLMISWFALCTVSNLYKISQESQSLLSCGLLQVLSFSWFMRHVIVKALNQETQEKVEKCMFYHSWVMCRGQKGNHLTSDKMTLACQWRHIKALLVICFLSHKRTASWQSHRSNCSTDIRKCWQNFTR